MLPRLVSRSWQNLALEPMPLPRAHPSFQGWVALAIQVVSLSLSRPHSRGAQDTLNQVGGAGPRSCAGLEVGVGIIALQYFTLQYFTTQQVSFAQRGAFSACVCLCECVCIYLQCNM